MTGFEPRTSGIGSDRSTNWATTTAQQDSKFTAIFDLLLGPLIKRHLYSFFNYNQIGRFKNLWQIFSA